MNKNHCIIQHLRRNNTIKYLMFTMAAVIMCGSIYPVFAQISGKSFQLLEDRGLGVLRDRFTRTLRNEYVIKPDDKTEVTIIADPTPHLTIVNKATQTLTIDLNGRNGNYHLTAEPRSSDRTWHIKAGSYNFEVSIPGFPPAAGQIELIEKYSHVWEIWRKQP